MSGGKMLRARVRRADHALCILICFATTLCSAQGTQPAEPMPVSLRDGQTLSATHEATERFTYVVDITDDATYLIRVDQRGLDLIVTVETPNGVTESFNSPLLRDEAELVLLDGGGPGRYEVSLYSDEYTGATAAHSIQLTRLPAAADGREVEAWRLTSRGSAANFDAGEEGWPAAVAAYERAADLWRELGRTKDQAYALFSVATVEYWQLYNWDRSAELAATSAELYADLGEAALSANARHLQAAALVESALEAAQPLSSSETAAKADALFAQALLLFEQAASVHERLGNVYELGLITNNFGYTHYNKGDLERARTYYQQAAALMQSADEWRGELSPRSNLAVLDAEAGDVRNAIDTLERIIEILPPGGLLRYRADTLVNLGLAHRTFGNVEQALEALSSAIEIQRTIEDLQGEGRSLRGIGETYYIAGELDLATLYLEQALPIARQTNDGRPQEAILRTLGSVAFLEGDYTGALEHHRQALAIAASTHDRAHLQVLIAKDLVALGRYEEAKLIAAEARAVAENSGSESLVAAALHAAGRAQARDPDAAAAIANLERAAAIYERLELGGQRAEVFHGLALVTRDQGLFDDAASYGEASLAELESLRVRVADPELRAFFSASRRDYYETQIDLLMTLHARSSGASDEHLRAALHTSERSRARMTADLLQEASVDLRVNVDPDLQARRSALYERLAERRYQRDRLLERTADTGASEQLTQLLAALASTENELNLLEIEIRRRSPQFASLTAPEPLTALRIQQSLDEDSVLLQYALGHGKSYVWIATNDTLAALELADRATIEAAARRALDSVRTYSPNASGRAPYSADLKALADLVLAPVAEYLEKPRIVLALDGALQYIPFAVLPLEHPSGSSAPLLDSHEVVGIPSMSALAARPGRDDSARAARTLAVFADPVLEPTDPRLASTGISVAGVAALPHSFVARSSVGADLGRLLSTGHEAEAIAALVPDRQRFVARGFEASRKAVLETDLSRYQYLHFATHGLVDSRYPGLSALALSQFDEQGTAQNGFLRLHDIYSLRLNADLVVLSACESALGREVRGEALIGLTQGFMYAGARSVVASLWPVPDRATAELMTRFYGYMLNESLEPAAALRKAQLASASERRWSNPYFWAGFVLLGDW